MTLPIVEKLQAEGLQESRFINRAPIVQRRNLDGDEAVGIIRDLYEALAAVKQASLFVDDDGEVRITEEPYISVDLFSSICGALAKARGEA